MDTKKNVTSEVVHLSNKNEELCQELNEIDHLAQQLERHKEIVLETADKEIGEAKVISSVLPVGSTKLLGEISLICLNFGFFSCNRIPKGRSKIFFLIYLVAYGISH